MFKYLTSSTVELNKHLTVSFPGFKIRDLQGKIQRFDVSKMGQIYTYDIAHTIHIGSMPVTTARPQTTPGVIYGRLKVSRMFIST